MNRLTSWWPLIGLIIISTAAFFGFGKIFSSSDTTIGTQAVTAAFAALFIILSTKFLMGQEAETQRDLMQRQAESQRTLILDQEQNQREYDKERKIFEERLKVFSTAAKLVSEVMADGAIGKEELSKLRGMTLELHLSANKKALEFFTVFFEKCVEIYGKGTDEGDDSEIISLKPEDQRECWKHAAEFIVACREGLSLPGEDSPAAVLVGFSDLLEKVDDAVSVVRAPLEGGLAGYCELHKINELGSNALKKFFNELRAAANISPKFTKTEISLKGQVLKTNLIYMKPRAARTEISGGLQCFGNEEMAKMVAQIAPGGLASNHKRYGWGANFSIPYSFKEGHIEKLVEAIKHIEKGLDR